MLHEAIESALQRVAAEDSAIAWVRFHVGEDWSGTRSVFVRVVLHDAALTGPAGKLELNRVGSVTLPVRQRVAAALQPILEDWGLFPYVNFRLVSECEEHPCAEWVRPVAA